MTRDQWERMSDEEKLVTIRKRMSHIHPGPIAHARLFIMFLLQKLDEASR